MSYTKGTDLRSADGTYYEWPHPMFGHTNPRQYHGLTTVIRSFGADNDFAAATWTAQEAQRLHTAALNKEDVWRYAGSVWDGSRYENQYEQVPAAELLMDSEYLRKFQFSELGRCADRGTVVHELLHYYSNPDSFPLADADVPHWVQDVIGQGDGNKAYRCDEDETIGYCRSLNNWIHTVKPGIVMSEVAGFHDELGYACTMDAVLHIGDQLYLTDAKSRAATSLQDALQVMAQKNCTHLAVTGEDRRIDAAPILSVAIPSVLLVTPEKCTLRTVTKQDEAWDLFKRILGTFMVMKEHGFPSTKGLFTTTKELVKA